MDTLACCLILLGVGLVLVCENYRQEEAERRATAERHRRTLANGFVRW
jgi:hypothetical protein